MPLPSAKDQKRIVALVEKWRVPFLISEQWVIDVQFSPVEDDPPSYAEIHVNQRYHEASVIIYPLFWTKGEEYQERTVVHELAHIVSEHQRLLTLRSMEGWSITPANLRDVSETTTDWIANILWAATKGCVPKAKGR